MCTVWWFGGLPFWSLSLLFHSVIVAVLLLQDAELSNFPSIYSVLCM